MKLDLTKVFEITGESLPFSAELDLGEVKRWNEQVIDSTVLVVGSAENHSGIISLTYTADFTLHAACGRCLTAIVRREQMKFMHTMVLSLNREDNDEFIVVPDGRLDLAELAVSDILLEFPTVMVCSDGCAGLCSICGKNLNEGVCTCRKQTGDSRFDKLRELLSDG